MTWKSKKWGARLDLRLALVLDQLVLSEHSLFSLVISLGVTSRQLEAPRATRQGAPLCSRGHAVRSEWRPAAGKVERDAALSKSL